MMENRLMKKTGYWQLPCYGNAEVVGILRTNEDLVVTSRVKLFPGLLEYSRLVDANVEEPSKGYILLVSSKTKELIGTLKMNGTVCSLAFADDGNRLLSSGSDGEVYHWDLRMRTCFHKAVDEGCINGMALCTSPNGRMFAAGSDSGIVNIYNRDDFLGGKRKPIKTVENLTTKVDFLKFNSDAQILAICSTMKKNSLKLIHVPLFAVYSNWSPLNKNLHYPWCLDFSPGGGFTAVGKVLLYKLHRYNHA
ncbi:U3 small nucleolar RNA-associated protein 18-like protein [Hibiscus syriacus]|uniref:U3 small nucleolar RNA-associated protein 18-like protein n=1 Tax=Hibiscus syriacus TaxID=106335 RepID=A0A6A2X4Y2_HIBSY|nr:U3 small nucleolar RNA-associated protein 18-like protein [Hibiscus syriacus]